MSINSRAVNKNSRTCNRIKSHKPEVRTSRARLSVYTNHLSCAQPTIKQYQTATRTHSQMDSIIRHNAYTSTCIRKVHSPLVHLDAHRSSSVWKSHRFPGVRVSPFRYSNRNTRKDSCRYNACRIIIQRLSEVQAALINPAVRPTRYTRGYNICATLFFLILGLHVLFGIRVGRLHCFSGANGVLSRVVLVRICVAVSVGRIGLGCY